MHQSQQMLYLPFEGIGAVCIRRRRGAVGKRSQQFVDPSLPAASAGFAAGDFSSSFGFGIL
jgi:hypothetical protein